jgi:hypothetical protein
LAGSGTRLGATVAVKVTDWSTVDGLAEAVTEVVVSALETVCDMVPAAATV